MTLSLPIPGCGFYESAVCVGCSGPDTGNNPPSGSRGAEMGEHYVAGYGPVEHSAISEVGRGFTDVVRQREMRWENYLIKPLNKKLF